MFYQHNVDASYYDLINLLSIQPIINVHKKNLYDVDMT